MNLYQVKATPFLYSLYTRNYIVYVFLEVFTLYQQYFTYLMATVLKFLFPRLLLTNTLTVHYPDIGWPVLVLFP